MPRQLVKTVNWSDINAGGFAKQNLQIDAAGVASGNQQFETVEQYLTVTGTTATIDFNLGSAIVLDVTGATGNVTVTLTNPKPSTYLIVVLSGATVRTITFPATVSLTDGGLNVYTPSGANQRDVLAVWRLNNLNRYFIAPTLNYA